METKNKLSRYWHFSIVSMFVLFVTLMPELAAASSTTLSSVFCNVVNLTQTSAGKGVAVAAVVILGLMALMGKISWGMGILVVLGIGLIFGASAIGDAIDASGTSCSDI